MLGANVTGIVYMLSKDFLGLVLIAILMLPPHKSRHRQPGEKPALGISRDYAPYFFFPEKKRSILLITLSFEPNLPLIAV